MTEIFCEECDRNRDCDGQNNGGGQLEYVCPVCFRVLKIEDDPAFDDENIQHWD